MLLQPRNMLTVRGSVRRLFGDDGRAQGVSWEAGYPADWEQSHSPPGSPGSNRIEAAVLLSAGKRRVRRIVVSDSSDEGHRGVQRPRIDAPQD